MPTGTCHITKPGLPTQPAKSWPPANRDYHPHLGLIRLRRPTTGTFCGRGHPQSIEVHTVDIGGVEYPRGQIGPGCWIAGCPDNEASRANEQQPYG
jgi:hypothetical protein